MANTIMNEGGSPDTYKFKIPPDVEDELKECFDWMDLNGDNVIQMNELKHALHIVGLKLPDYEVRILVERYGENKQSLTYTEFRELYKELKSKHDLQLPTLIQPRDIEKYEGHEEGIVHTLRNEEQVAFSDWINTNLSSDPDLSNHLPIDSEGRQLYETLSDGIVLCKLINLAERETIDERAINKKNLNAYTKRENQMLALNSAQAIGCNIVNIDADDLAKGKQHLSLGVLWQIIRIGLFNQISLKTVPGLIRLLKDGETLADLQRLSPEQILIRWVNYHMDKAGTDRRLANFTGDIKDSIIYTYLMKEIAPPESGVSLDPLYTRGDNKTRATAMLREADKIGCRAFVTPDDVTKGIYKLNLAFVANLFNTYPGLRPPAEDENLAELEEVQEETREEKTYRNWMNSMGVNPFVNWLYSDLCNGIIIFQLYDIIKPGVVNWKRVAKTFNKLRSMMDQIQNCNYAVELGQQLRFSLVGIQGKDLYDGNQTLTLALVWQLMRAYTLTILAQCTKSGDKLIADKEIVAWVNKKLRQSGKSSQINSFQDSSISNGRVVLDLIDSIKPGVVQWDVVKAGQTDDEKLANAKYAISMARKVGAKVYALPEDIVEVKSKMVLTVFACLMARDYMPNMGVKESSATPLGLED